MDSVNRRLNTVSTIRGWLNPCVRNHAYGRWTLGLQHRRILVPAVGPGTDPRRYRGTIVLSLIFYKFSCFL